jgi:hypothetical protein
VITYRPDTLIICKDGAGFSTAGERSAFATFVGYSRLGIDSETFSILSAYFSVIACQTIIRYVSAMKKPIVVYRR